MSLPRKVFFFGLRRQFNKAVETINGLATSIAKLIITIIELETRLAALEKRADMEDLLNGMQARYDAIIIEKEVEEETDEDTEERTED